MGKEYEAEAEMKLCPWWQGGSLSAGCWWHSQQTWRCWGWSWGQPTAAEAQSSVKAMPVGMPVPVEGKVGSSPDCWTQIQSRVKGSDSSMLSYLADKSTARTYGWKLTDVKLTSVLVRTWGIIFSSLCRAWNMNISLGRSGWYSRMKQIISLRSATTFATPCFQPHSTCDFYGNYRVFFPNVCFISPNMYFQVRCMAFLRETVLLLGLPIWGEF